MNGSPITHFACYFNSLGGMQSVLKRHFAHDQSHGLASQAVIFFDPASRANRTIQTLGLTGFHSIREVRRRVGQVRLQTPVGTAVYHDCWGLPLLADLDRANRRIGYLHNNPPDFRTTLRHQAGLLDGVICIGDHQIAPVRECLPTLEMERIALLPLPIPQTPRPQLKTPMANRPVVLGYSGRLQREQKRVERLVALCAALKDLGVAFRLEVLGDGPLRPWLEQKLEAGSSAVFHRTQTGDRYWQILGSWDFIAFVSDWEGLPNSLLEAMQCGVLPLYPRIGTGGDRYVAQVLPDLLYDPENFRQAAAAIRKVQQLPVDALEKLRARCRDLVRPHQAENYFSMFYQFVQRINEAPRVSRSQFARRRAYFTDFWLLGILSRLYPTSLLKQTPPGSRSPG
ncbi:MAG: glycosyltransferase [Limisphaerales bacterium]